MAACARLRCRLALALGKPLIIISDKVNVPVNISARITIGFVVSLVID